MNEAKGSLCIELTIKPLLHVVLNKRKCVCRLNSNKDYSCSKGGKNRACKAVIGYGFPSHRLLNWCEIFKPIIKRSNCNHVITFDSH